jgi:epoxide hydrolase-like predicted phosphatase
MESRAWRVEGSAEVCYHQSGGNDRHGGGQGERVQRQAVIFDWGGVLMRTADYAPRHAWDARLGLAAGQVESVVHGIEAWTQVQRGEIEEAAYWRAVAAALGLDEADAARLRADFYRGDALDEALVALIRRLRGRGLLVGLLSNNAPGLAAELDALGLADLFDARAISAEIGVMKPDPAAYHAILDRLDVPPGAALFVDDSADNVAGARAVGMAAVRFTPDLDVEAAVDAWLEGA